MALDPMRPEYRGLSSDLASYARGLVGKNATPYTGGYAAPLSSGENSILARINAMVPGGDGASTDPFAGMAFGPQRSDLISQILSGSRSSPTNNPYLGDTINYLRDQGSRTLGSNMNLLDAAFGKSGMGTGSGRSNEATELARSSTADTNAQISQILGNNFQQGQQDQMTTLSSILPGMDANMQQLLFSALGANSLPRSIAQENLTGGYNEFLRQQQAPTQYASLAAQILGSAPQMQFMMPQYQPSNFQNLMSTAGQAGSAALPFLV